MVRAAASFASEDDGAPLPALPDGSPVRTFGGFGAWGDGDGRPLPSALKRDAARCGGDAPCGVHGPRPASA